MQHDLYSPRGLTILLVLGFLIFLLIALSHFPTQETEIVIS
jgi:hypothetical protein